MFSLMRQLQRLAVRVLDRDTRAHVELAILTITLERAPVTLVDPFLHRLAFEDVAVLNLAADFGDDRRGVRIPFRDQLAALDLVAVALAQFRAVNQRIALAFALAHHAGIRGDLLGDGDFAVPRHDDQTAVARFHGVTPCRRSTPSLRDFQGGLLGAPAGGTADMEGAHRELGARLAD